MAVACMTCYGNMYSLSNTEQQRPMRLMSGVAWLMSGVAWCQFGVAVLMLPNG
jgi:hypothetical protein